VTHFILRNKVKLSLLVGIPLTALLAVVLPGILVHPSDAGGGVVRPDTTIKLITLTAGVTPTAIHRNDTVHASCTVALSSTAPAPVTITVSGIPSHGGTVSASFTLPLDKDAVHGFDVPVGTAKHLAPGDYQITVRAQAYRNSAVFATKTISFTVLP
jgi:hypothetical protein